MLPLDRQNEYRRRYAARVRGWRSSGEVFESLVRDSLGPAARLLDIGGGRGGLIEKVHPSVAEAAVLDPDFLSLAEHRAPAVRRVCGLAGALPFPADHFHLVTAAWLLEHLSDPAAAFAEIGRVLRSPDPASGRPGGRFIFLTPNARHPLLLANRLSLAVPALQRRLVPRLYARAEADTFPVQYKANTRAALQALCREAGFRLELFTVADPTYIAFNEPLFRLSALLERLLPPAFKIHLAGIAIKNA